MDKKKVAIALSGGVDSGVAAALLVKQGLVGFGIHLQFCSVADDQNLLAAQATCQKLKIPFQVLACQKVFKKKVIDYFLRAYSQGLTPNPCVVCNQQVKFGWLLDYVFQEGFDFLATGHYARLVSDSNYHLLLAKDRTKDQAYFLYRLDQKQLNRILFPLGEFSKKNVRKLAQDWDLPVAKSRESQNVCFLSETKQISFLKEQIPKELVPGEVVDLRGRVIGTHQGLPLYTIGQRTGFKITERDYQRHQQGKMVPHYVIGKQAEENQLVVGARREAQKKEFWVKDLSWVYPGARCFLKRGDLRVKIRSSGELLEVEKIKEEKDRLKVELKKPELGVAPGQSAVFYQKFKDDFEVLGGGIIIDLG